MNIQFLGVHMRESRNSRLFSMVIDGVLAIDAGSLAAGLSFAAQERLKAILLTHQHYDHVRDVPAIAMNFALRHAAVNIYSTQPVYDVLAAYLLNGKIYPNFLEWPPENPAIKFTVIEPHKPRQIEGYDVLPVPMAHSVPTVGYQVTAPDGKVAFYTGDTGIGLDDCWRHISPQLLIIEVTAPNKYEQFGRNSGHLTPGLLKLELASFRKIKGYLPRVVVVHVNPTLRREIETELATVASELNNPIILARRGMRLHL